MGDIFWPASGASSNPSVAATGSTAPSFATEVAGVNPSGNLTSLKLDSSGNLLVSLNADPVTPLNVNLQQVGGAAFALGQQLAAASLPVVLTAAQLTTLTPISTVTVIQPTAANLNATVTGTVAATQSGTWNITNVSGTVSLPTGAATDAHLTNVQSAAGTSASTLITVQGSATGVAQPVSLASSPLPTGASTAALQSNVQSAVGSSATTAITVQGSASGAAVPVSGTVAATQSGTWNITNVSGTVSLPTGAATDAHLTNVQSAVGTAATTAITIQGSASGVALPTIQAGHGQGNAPVLTSYSGTNVTSAAYVQIVASTTNAVNLVELFDSSGQTIYFATGAGGSEVNQFIIYPGGNAQVPFKIAAGTRISYKATGTSATTGINVLNLYT